jgi:hypothetical protein
MFVKWVSDASHPEQGLKGCRFPISHQHPEGKGWIAGWFGTVCVWERLLGKREKLESGTSRINNRGPQVKISIAV